MHFSFAGATAGSLFAAAGTSPRAWGAFSSARALRREARPRRILALMVPRGCPNSFDISDWDIPPKKARSTAIRWFSLRRSSAARTRARFSVSSRRSDALPSCSGGAARNFFGRGGGGATVTFARPQAIDRLSLGNHGYPRKQFAPSRVVGGNSLPYLQKRFLKGVLRFPPVFQDSQNHRINARGEAPIKKQKLRSLPREMPRINASSFSSKSGRAALVWCRWRKDGAFGLEENLLVFDQGAASNCMRPCSI